MRAIVLDFPATQAEVDDWFGRNWNRLQALSGRVTLSPDYPMVVTGRQLPALGPVRFAVLAGVCARGEGPALAALSQHFPGAVLRNVRLPHGRIACPTVNQAPPGASAEPPRQVIRLDGLVLSDPVPMGMAPVEAPDTPEDLGEEDGDEHWPVHISPRLLAATGPRLGTIDRAQALRLMFPGLGTQPSEDPEDRTEIVEVQIQVARWLSFTDPDSDEIPAGDEAEHLRLETSEPAMAVLVKLRSDMGDSEWMSTVAVAVIGRRGGRPVVLARLDGGEIDAEVVDDEPSRVRWRLGKQIVAPGLFCLRIVVREEQREEQNRLVNEDAMLFAIEGSAMYQVANFSLGSLDEGREQDDGGLYTWKNASRTRVQVLPDPAGPFYRLRLDSQTTEQEDGRVVFNERDRTVLCFSDAEYMDCGEPEQDELEGTLGPDGLYVR